MSSYVVSDECMHLVVSAIEQMSRDPNCFHTLGRRHNEEGPVQLSAIGDLLFEMNYRAYDDRYPSEKTNESLPPKYRFKSIPNAVSPRGLKAIECFLYQCSEGDVPESDLYKRIAKLKNRVAMTIVQNMPEYEGAPWG